MTNTVAGDHFEQRVRAHVDLLFSVAMNFTRDATRAESLTCETLTKAFAHQDHAYVSGSMKTWLLGLLRETFTHEYRMNTSASEPARICRRAGRGNADTSDPEPFAYPPSRRLRVGV